MIRTVLCAAASLLMIGVLYAQEKKSEAKAEATKEKSPDAVKKESKEGIKKDDPEAKKKQLKEGVKKEGLKSEGGSHKGRLTKIGVESGVVKLLVEGKEYDFIVTDNTLAVLKIAELNGRQVVLGFQLADGPYGIIKDGEKNPADKPQSPKKSE